MPPGGAPARGRQLATLGKLSHEKLEGRGMGKVWEDVRSYEDSQPHDSEDSAVIRVTGRNYEKATKVPTAWLADFITHTTACYEAWTKARPANDFKSVQPLLEKTLDYSRQYADFFPGYQHIADPLIDDSDYGVKASFIRELFGNLRTQLVPIVQAITAQPPADASSLHQDYSQAAITDFAKDVIKRFGYDFERGRLDTTHHPYMIKFSIGDARILTRYPENDIADPLFSVLHEAGHALYEQGLCPDYEGTPLARGTSSGVHESQSRLWENIVGRSREFWQYFYPGLQSALPAQFTSVSLDTFYRAVNRVVPSLIRTEADEVTSNLHIILRFHFELQMLEGKLAVRDLPEAWHERYKADLGVTAPDDRDGVLQDVHWYSGTIGGAFQGYTLGNILSAQFYQAALRAHPEITAETSRGEFGTLHGWLKENIYQYGKKFDASQLVERVTGGPLAIEPYIDYLRSKYGALYPL